MTTTDLTSTFMQAWSQAQEWPYERFSVFLKSLIDNLPMTTLSFDYEGGEDWALIRYARAAIAFVRLDFPLIIIVDEWATKIEVLLEQEKVVVVRVPDMESGRYSLEPSAVPVIFPNNVWVPDIDPKDFSLGDLWWTTIT